ncbi:MAG: hypothetical protein ACTSRR_09760 [Candidatus Heimdallarchaeaceae archaeon]
MEINTKSLSEDIIKARNNLAIATFHKKMDSIITDLLAIIQSHNPDNVNISASNGAITFKNSLDKKTVYYYGGNKNFSIEEIVYVLKQLKPSLTISCGSKTIQ